VHDIVPPYLRQTLISDKNISTRHCNVHVLRKTTAEVDSKLNTSLHGHRNFWSDFEVVGRG
jgi:hypothetical protein